MALHKIQVILKKEMYKNSYHIIVKFWLPAYRSYDIFSFEIKISLDLSNADKN